jgi:hypothetical protein
MPFIDFASMKFAADASPLCIRCSSFAEAAASTR